MTDIDLHFRCAHITDDKYGNAPVTVGSGRSDAGRGARRGGAETTADRVVLARLLYEILELHGATSTPAAATRATRATAAVDDRELDNRVSGRVPLPTHRPYTVYA